MLEQLNEVRLPAETELLDPVAGRWGPFRRGRLRVVVPLIFLAALPGGLGALTRELIADAYIQVSAFVATTLILFYGMEKLMGFDLGDTLRNARSFQVPLAALLGATPGCGGAVVVVAAYSSGNVGFGAVVATLTATMGDAAFLLIATKPEVAIVVLPLSFTLGIITGYVVDRFCKADYGDGMAAHCDVAPLIGTTSWKYLAYGIVAVPGLVFGLSQIFQLDLEARTGNLSIVVGLLGTFLGLLIWGTSRLAAMTHPDDSAITRMAEETSFISVWVVVAYLAYDYLDAYGGLDLESMFSTFGVALPLIAVLIGFIPGCGPQVLVATLYINGVVPFSALMGNAVANDGDALFPAIALNPKAAVMATIYSAVPALLIAYAVHFVVPGLFN